MTVHSYCDGCGRWERQLSDHYDADQERIEYLCGPCWRWAIYWDSIRPYRHWQGVA